MLDVVSDYFDALLRSEWYSVFLLDGRAAAAAAADFMG